MAILERYEEAILAPLDQKDIVPVLPLQGLRTVEPKGLTPLSHPDEQAWYSWWKKPEAQLERARELWPHIQDWPEPPKVFNTKDEVILLHVAEPIDALWAKVEAPHGYTKFRSDIFDAPWDTADAAQYAGNHAQWVWYNFMHGRGEAPRSLRTEDGYKLAGREVLSALIQFDYAEALSNNLPSPILSGSRLNYDGEDTNVLYIRKDTGRKVLELCVQWDGTRSSGYVSPSVMTIG